jgi:hypothetical protein
MEEDGTICPRSLRQRPRRILIWGMGRFLINNSTREAHQAWAPVLQVFLVMSVGMEQEKKELLPC